MSLEQQRIKLMLSKLCKLSGEGQIDNEWAEGFIWNLDNLVNNKGEVLTSKQQAKLEELFDQFG